MSAFKQDDMRDDSGKSVSHEEEFRAGTLIDTRVAGEGSIGMPAPSGPKEEATRAGTLIDTRVTSGQGSNDSASPERMRDGS